MANPDSTCSGYFYDVFLSFRGETRYGFTGHLYSALCKSGINAFIDEELRIGDEIEPTLVEAIENSRMSMIVLSANYASSTWCLDELHKIIECHKKGQQVLAIFYKVEPLDVQEQKNAYEEAMIKHEQRLGQDSAKVKAWRSALSGVCDLSREHCGNNRYESELIKKIVNDTLAKLPHLPSDIKRKVGLDSRFEQVKSLIDIESNNIVRILQIYGAGGIGKTTFAKDLYDKIRHRFEAACFLDNVREKSNKSIKGLEYLQKKMLSEMGEETEIMMGSIFRGASEIKLRLGRKRVLLVLDDVDSVKQLEALAGGGDWFGSGSRIVITTRDTSVLDKHVMDYVIVKKYEMEVLNNGDSLELFCWHAFNMSRAAENLANISNRAISYAKGLPLALKAIGSNLKSISIEEWGKELDEYEKVANDEIQGVLERSYNSLFELDQKSFLDIACFFKGEKWEYVQRILKACDFFSRIRVFVCKCLITIDESGCLEMHNLIQDMGREIIRRKSPLNPGDRCRLWSHEEILQVLKENSGSSTIEGIILDPPQLEEVDCWTASAFEKMKNLRILIIRNTRFSVGPTYLPNHLRLLDWEQCPLHSFPRDFYPERIVDFHLPHSCLILENSFQKFEDLTFINLSDCQSITQIPDMSQAKRLRTLTLNRCKKLVGFDKSVGFMPNLVYLSASECSALKSFVPTMYLPSLERLFFNSCSTLEHFPHVVQKMDKPLMIHMIGTAIQQLPDSIGNLTGLEYIDTSFCKELRDLPRNFFLLPKLVTLKMSGCSLLGGSFKRFKESHSIANGCPNLKTLYFRNANLVDEDLHVILEIFPKLEDLRVTHNNFMSLPESIKRPVCLKSLDVSCCRNLQEIPELSPSIQKVNARHCWSLTSEASISLSSKVGKEKYKFEVVMPNKMEIPQRFDHLCNCIPFPLFWVRRKFPIVALSFVFGEMFARGILSIGAPLEFDWKPVGLRLFIDGREVCCKEYHYFDVGENHMLLCDIRVLLNDEEWESLDASLGDDWKVVQVYCISQFIVRQWGVYVYKQENNTEDIKFSLPSPTSSRPCLPSLLVPRTPERILWQNPFDDILNMTTTLPAEEVRTLELRVLSITDNDKTSAITYGTSLNQQKQDFIRQFDRVYYEALPVLTQQLGALFSNPEMANTVTSIAEELKRNGLMDEGSPYGKVMQRTLGKPKSLKDWIDLMNAIISIPFEDNQLMKLREGFQWTANIHEASTTADNGTKLKQQDEASSSNMVTSLMEESQQSGKMDEASPFSKSVQQRNLGEPKSFTAAITDAVASSDENQLIQSLKGLMSAISDQASASADNGTKLKQQDEASSSSQALQFIEVFSSTPATQTQIPTLKDIFGQVWEEINRHGS